MTIDKDSVQFRKLKKHGYLGEWSKTCRYCEGRAAANLAKLVKRRQNHAVPTVS